MDKKVKVEPPSNSGCETDEDENVNEICSIKPDFVKNTGSSSLRGGSGGRG